MNKKDMEDGRNDFAMAYCWQVTGPSEERRERLEEHWRHVSCAELVKVHHRGNVLAEVWEMFENPRTWLEQVLTSGSWLLKKWWGSIDWLELRCFVTILLHWTWLAAAVVGGVAAVVVVAVVVVVVAAAAAAAVVVVVVVVAAAAAAAVAAVDKRQPSLTVWTLTWKFEKGVEYSYHMGAVVVRSDPPRPMESCCYSVQVIPKMEKTSRELGKRHSNLAMLV
jgi:hypothetical protein